MCIHIKWDWINILSKTKQKTKKCWINRTTIEKNKTITRMAINMENALASHWLYPLEESITGRLSLDTKDLFKQHNLHLWHWLFEHLFVCLFFFKYRIYIFATNKSYGMHHSQMRDKEIFIVPRCQLKSLLLILNIC